MQYAVQMNFFKIFCKNNEKKSVNCDINYILIIYT